MPRLTQLGVFYRPYMMDTIRKLAQDFELMIFSDGLRELHTKIVEKIDPENKYFSFRLYREHCYQSDKGYFVKDLRVINRPFDSMVLVDNSTCAFGFQLANGVPVIPYTGGEDDTELLLLTEYLQFLLPKPDVRKANREHFKFELYVGAESMQAVYDRVFKAD